jgi:hypothetical protein
MQEKSAPAFFMRSNYLDKTITSLSGFDVREYDMRDAGLSLIKSFKLLPEGLIKQLEDCDKLQRNISVGKLRKKHPDFSRQLTKAFRDTMYKFLVDNNVDGNKVLSIKNDAVFIIGSFKPEFNTINGVEFAMKSKFSSYYLLGDKEFYYSCWDDELVTKGIGGESLEAHMTDGLLFELKKVMRAAENVHGQVLLRMIRKFRHRYIARLLPVQCYREINAGNMFVIKQENSLFRYTTDRLPDEHLLPDVCIQHNFINYVAPLIGLLS